MILFPRAKINIGLHITEKRQDGYHNLQTIFYPVNLYDALEFVVRGEKFTEDELTTTGIPVDCPPEKNLVIKALSMLREYRSVPYIRIHLHKAIPNGAGLGGGSSDAATFIKGLNRYFGLGLTNDTLKEIALSIGSDCPFFIDGVPVYAEGRGELTTPVRPIPEVYYLVLVKPELVVNTGDAYRDCLPYKREGDLTEYYLRDIREWKNRIVNDFEKTVFIQYPVIGKIKEELYGSGAVYSSMSGSGSAVYGIFRNIPELPLSLRSMVIYSGRL